MAITVEVFCFVLLVTGFSARQLFAADDSAYRPGLNQAPVYPAAVDQSTTAQESVVPYPAKRAKFGQERASHESRHLADWVVHSGDNRSLPFIIVDKTDAKVFVFYPDGQLRGAAPALLGLALGDAAVPGIGNRKLSSIRPEERTTPAGRFVAALGRNLRGVEILWVDYAGAVSMHPVVTSNSAEFRAQRLATPTPLDNRISYGCINVPAKFFRDILHTAFAGTNGIVYVLPETRAVHEVFDSYYDVEKHARQPSVSQPVPAHVPSGTAPH